MPLSAFHSRLRTIETQETEKDDLPVSFRTFDFAHGKLRIRMG
jgi:hypothetical protein